MFVCGWGYSPFSYITFGSLGFSLISKGFLADNLWKLRYIAAVIQRILKSEHLGEGTSRLTCLKRKKEKVLYDMVTKILILI